MRQLGTFGIVGIESAIDPFVTMRRLGRSGAKGAVPMVLTFVSLAATKSAPVAAPVLVIRSIARGGK
jgi:hypothetical protein